ncbi:glycosyltransferase family 2 protein [Lactococcus lactis]|uniref:glycosyltransferase family 2 protein n=1 Tax=Lactococcus lactis TaxID=1358 RepID=UPI0021FCB15E|nr:glycosyltransferase family 2 protein [Lactococcus lactis]MCT1181601.1 glycosyltransferase family 2 protein [Lactococcus lactis]MCT3130179.1 glycosyltransferase family 2 protein [Lactococcus lactis]UWX38756.1 beta-1,3-glucosyltransferase [Lactococcus lactis subsp. lactis]
MVKFSIIIPVYNLEDYLYRCLESVLNQDYNDFEIIFINDGSDDNSLRPLNHKTIQKLLFFILTKEASIRV